MNTDKTDKTDKIYYFLCQLKFRKMCLYVFINYHFF